MNLVVGIQACAKVADERPVHTTPARYAAAIMGGVGGLPVMIPPVGEQALALLDRLDGLLVPGSPSNVHPSHYGVDESETPDRHDPERDATSLPLIRAAIARGLLGEVGGVRRDIGLMARANVIGGGIESIGTARDENDVRALIGKHLGAGLADSLGAACDQDGLSSQLQIHDLCCLSIL